MAVETLRPTSTPTAAWPGVTGAATHHEATNDNSDASYIRNNTSSDTTDVFEITDTALTTETIDSVDIRFRARSETSASGHIQMGLRLGGSDTLAADETSISTSVTNFTKTALARPGGGSWAVADLNALQLLCTGSNGGGTAIRCFELYVDVNYTAAGTTVKDIIGSGVIPFAR